MHPTAAAVASTGTRACLSRYGTHRESTDAVVIPCVCHLYHCRELGGCWILDREAQHSRQLVRMSEGGAEGGEPTMLFVAAQACFEAIRTVG